MQQTNELHGLLHEIPDSKSNLKTQFCLCVSCISIAEEMDTQTCRKFFNIYIFSLLTVFYSVLFPLNLHDGWFICHLVFQVWPWLQIPTSRHLRLPILMLFGNFLLRILPIQERSYTRYQIYYNLYWT